MSIHYSIEPAHPEAHLYTVTLSLSEPDPAGQQLTLPTWIPGSYMIRDFARNIVSISASSEGQPVRLEKCDKSRWQAPSGLGQLTVVCDIYAWDLSVRSAHLDATHGFFNGTSVFLAVEGQTHLPCSVTIKPPADIPDWRVATSLQAESVNDAGFGEYQAVNYDDLIDHPVEMGTFERAVFTACGVEHELVLTGRYVTDIDRICNDLTKICEYQIRFFGEPAPVKRYVFLVMVVGDGYGGLEHRASTSLMCKREHLPVPGDTAISDAYLEFLGLCSHEYFHTWNVKRIKPARFVPYELAAESYTELLWAFEGITSYYDDLTLVRVGLIDQPRYLKLLAKMITRVHRGSGRLKQSVAESSFDAWTKFYKQDENAPNAIVSYYAKGALVAFSLDVLIRQKSEGSKSLDDLMQLLWQAYLTTAEGVTQAQIEALVADLCGQDVGEFFQRAVFGTEDLPLTDSLSFMGIETFWRASESPEDTGGTEASADEPPLTLGMRTVNADGGLKITHVFDDGPAQKAGFSAGDRLMALGGLAATQSLLASLLRRHCAEDELTAHLFRRDELLVLPVRLETAPLDTCYLSVADSNKTELWLG
ncbi:MAG: PDZ domain-containing protein [Granulosicoccus sp.]|nr:PDZ domain-containing protein [Granulosicoccus sp.]